LMFRIPVLILGLTLCAVALIAFLKRPKDGNGRGEKDAGHAVEGKKQRESTAGEDRYWINEEMMTDVVKQSRLLRQFEVSNGKDFVEAATPIDLKKNIDVSRIHFSAEIPPDTWPIIQKVIAALNLRNGNILKACYTCGKTLAYHLIQHIAEINHSGINQIKMTNFCVRKKMI